MNVIYLDNNATTRLAPEVAEAMLECYRQGWGNPSSQHQIGRQARRRLEESREIVGRLLGADVARDRVIFTSGGTEANHLLWLGIPRQHRRAVVSAMEHPSVLGAAELWRAQGGELLTWKPDERGVCDPASPRDERLAEIAREDCDIVSLMLANHETGVRQPVERLAAAFPRAVVWHADAVQAVGKVEVRFRELGISAMTVAAHKFHGPLGIGALILRDDVPLQPLFRGGFQQQGFRPGTEVVPLTVGMARALELWWNERRERAERMERLRDRLAAGLLAADPRARVIGADAERLPQTLCLSFVGLDRQALLMACDLAGVACSTGSACASGSSEPSPVLQAMGCEASVVQGALRFSLSHETTAQEVDEAIRRIRAVLARFR
jgi:cysteine desulfurase